MDGTIFIPLMVVIPIICAVLVNLLHEHSGISKIFGYIGAICLPIIPILAVYGNHFFGGYQPLVNGGLTATLPEAINSIVSGTVLELFHPAITYAFGPGQQVIVHIRISSNVCSIHINR